MTDAVMAVDQGTTSTRAIIFDHRGLPIASEQMEHRQIFPAPGWVEHDPAEIWNNTRNVMGAALAKSDLRVSDIKAVGITQQRETTIIWDRVSGNPVYNAVVWQDTRNKELCDQLADGDPRRYAARTGLPMATYFSGPKARWILDNVPGARHRANDGDLLFGTMDTFLLWAMTGGPNGGVHVTDVTNASRTMLMDLDTQQWDPAAVRGDRRPHRDAPGDPQLLRGLRHHHLPPVHGGRPDRGHPGRPAGRHVRAGVPGPRHGQEHVRHRQLRPAEHRHQEGASRRTGW